MTCLSNNRSGRVHRTHHRQYVRWLQEPDEIVPINPPERLSVAEWLMMCAMTFCATVLMGVVWWYFG